jgi:hypothetical protein
LNLIFELSLAADAVVLLFTICSVWAAPREVEVKAQAAQYGYGYNYGQYPMMNQYQQPMGFQNPMGMGNYGGSYGDDSYDGPMNPSKYLNMKDEEFGIDYSMGCSRNPCGCRSSCMIIWWQPCYCRCECLTFCFN